MPVDTQTPSEVEEALRRRVAELEAALASATKQLTSTEVRLATTTETLSKTSTALVAVTAERDKLRRAYEQLKTHLELLRRRIFLAKAERVDTRQLEIEFAETHAKLVKLATELGEPASTLSGDAALATPSDGAAPPSPPKRKPKGRRKVEALDLPEQRVVIDDPALEGVAERIGFDESYVIGYQRGGPIRIVKARVVYKTTPPDGGEPTFTTARNPKEVYQRGLLAPAMIAHLLTRKFCWGMPFHRLSKELASAGFDLDDTTMGRYAEHVGATLGALVDAWAKEAKASAFCLATDATGVCIRPAPIPDGKRQTCRKGHFFVVLADMDHVFFEYQARHTSEAVCGMFKGYTGYIQADAHSVYEALYRGDAVEKGEKPPDEVGCWSHARRRMWEAAVGVKDPRAREGLLRIRALFKLDEGWAALAPKQRHDRRQRVMRPTLDAFFVWAGDIFEGVRGQRGVLSAAFGYVIRQREALSRFLDDGRLRLDNNASERALRPIAAGRKAWLFIGSHDHAQAAANIFSIVASCRLHSLDVESYLTDIIRVLPYWPPARYLELAPKHWRATRARLVEAEMKLPIGRVTVPPPPAEQQPPAN